LTRSLSVSCAFSFRAPLHLQMLCLWCHQTLKETVISRDTFIQRDRHIYMPPQPRVCYMLVYPRCMNMQGICMFQRLRLRQCPLTSNKACPSAIQFFAAQHDSNNGANCRELTSSAEASGTSRFPGCIAATTYRSLFQIWCMPLRVRPYRRRSAV
jgi:hypothetical protein